MNAWSEDGGYPTQAALDRLETWPAEDMAGALDFVKAIWHWPDFASHELRPHEAALVRAEPGERYLRLATGGWSGNEAIVAALQRNRLIHLLTWRVHARGGLWIYQYPTPTTLALAASSEPHVIGTDPPTVENDPVGRFRVTS